MKDNQLNQEELIKKMDEANKDRKPGQAPLIPVQVITKKKKGGGCGTFFAGFIFSLIFIVGSVVGLGAYVYFGVTITQIEQLLGVQTPIQGDIRDKSIRELVDLALQYKDDYVHLTIGEIETVIGVDLPETIPGTHISISDIYSATITIAGSSVEVQNVELMYVINNTTEFVDALLPALYDMITIGDLLETAQFDTTVEDMGYPGLADAIYNVGTESAPVYKTLLELSISEAQDVLVNYYGSENLTVQKVVNALGLQELIPDPVSGEVDLYAGIRDLVITNISSEQIMNGVTGGLLDSLIDLTDYPFTQTDTFKSTSLSNMLDYLQTVPLNQLLDIPDAITATSTATDKLLYAVRNLTVNDVLAEDFLTGILTLIDSADGYPNLTLGELIDFSTMSNADMFSDVLFTDLIRDPTTTFNNVIDNIVIGDFITLSGIVDADFFTNNPEFSTLQDTKLSDFPSAVKALKMNQILTVAQITSAGLNTTQAEMTLQELLQANTGSSVDTLISASVVDEVGGYLVAVRNTTSADFETTFDALSIMEIIGTENSVGVLANLATLNVGDLADDPDVLTTVLAKFGTLSDLCGGNTTGIFSIIGSINISDLVSNPDAIMNALQSSTTTLSAMLGFTPTNSLISAVASIQVKDLFGSNVEAAIMAALCGPSNERTLADLLGMTSTSGITQIIANISVADLLGSSPETAFQNALQNATTVTLADLFDNTDNNALMNIIGTLSVADLFGTNPGAKIYDALGTSTTTLYDFIGASGTTGMAGTILTQLTLADLFSDTADITATMDNIINGLLLSQIFDTSTMSTDSILYILMTKPGNENLTVSGLEGAVGAMTLRDVIGTPTTGFLALPGVNLDVTVGNFDDALSSVDIQSVDIETLINLELFTVPAGTTASQWAGITLGTIIEYYVINHGL